MSTETMKPEKFSLTKRLKSFSYAFNGLRLLVKEEHNARIHIVAALIAIGLGWYFDISSSEWVMILFAIGFVFVTELVNTAIENIADFISPEKHTAIKTIKDLAAGAVLVASLVALAVGLIVFVPKCMTILGS